MIVRGLYNVWSKIQTSRQPWLTFEFATFLWCTWNLTCILGTLHLQVSSRTCMSNMWSCVAKDSWKMVDVSQVMITHTIICKIHASRLTTHVRNELNCSCNCTEILAFLTMKLELLSPLLSDSPLLSAKSFFVFPIFDVQNAKSRPTFCHVFWGSNTVNKYSNDNCRYCIIFTVFHPKTKIETPLLCNLPDVLAIAGIKETGRKKSGNWKGRVIVALRHSREAFFVFWKIQVWTEVRHVQNVSNSWEERKISVVCPKGMHCLVSKDATFEVFTK